ncbi:MAG: HDIG domain-containing protein [Deltaproteobacteria bacterium]|nr:HDIG domain-containing protein [Deltaproteobacteria bacterium]
MIPKISELEPSPRLASIQGVIFAASSALFAEGLLSSFAFQDTYLASVARVLVIIIALYIVHRFSYASFRSYKPSFKDCMTMSLLMFGAIVTISMGKVLAASLVSYFAKSSYLQGISAESLVFSFPFAAGGLLVQAVLGLHFGIVFALSLAVIVGVYFPLQPILIPYVLCANLVACLSLARFRSRSAYTRAAFNLALIALPFALASVILDGSLTAADVTVRFAGVVVSAVLCSSIAAGFTPIFEFLGGYVTDMRLIEMATLDHPLLKELSVQAPGTWNHSMVMGMMVESAANAIGANSVVARVGAYFHDIGKTKKPLYFVENQIPGENRHDKLSPSMSALIIRSHVKDGIELARKYKLPRIIEDMIPQHHGTSLIEYFYDKASKEAKEADENSAEVDTGLYSYPGPRPQTKEAGILMLADGVEAAARTLSDPSHDRIQGLVQKMINKVFASGELDECELTLKDLHAIAKSFTRVLAGIYHQRIAYAEPAEKGGEKPAAKAEGKPGEAAKEEAARTEVAGGGAAKKPKDQGEEKQGREESKDDLKRLGM